MTYRVLRLDWPVGEDPNEANPTVCGLRSYASKGEANEAAAEEIRRERGGKRVLSHADCKITETKMLDMREYAAESSGGNTRVWVDREMSYLNGRANGDGEVVRIGERAWSVVQRRFDDGRMTAEKTVGVCTLLHMANREAARILLELAMDDDTPSELAERRRESREELDALARQGMPYAQRLPMPDGGAHELLVKTVAVEVSPQT